LSKMLGAVGISSSARPGSEDGTQPGANP
jgi:hypothetical protein